MSSVTYRKAVEAIAALESRGWRLGIDRMQEFCRRVGLSEALGTGLAPRFIHVAGTNGKGSTTAFLQSLLVAGGYQTGAFFSPYVVDYRERIQLGLDLISEADLAECTATLLPIADSLTNTEYGGVTKFEFETALGLLYWQKKDCEWVALEVGLGGRLDATNVVTPRASVIVSIGLDHTAILGDSIEKIAAEKAGIIKPSVPVIVGEMPSEAREVIARQAASLGAPLWRLGHDFAVEKSGTSFSVTTPRMRYDGLSTGIEGWMQPHNAALALGALEASGLNLGQEAVMRGIREAYAPGRFQHATYRGREMILDGAHNCPAASALRKMLDESYPGRGIYLVTNMLSGHDPLDFYQQVADRVARADVVPIDYFRSLPVTEVAKLLSRIVPLAESHASVRSGLDAAVESVSSDGLIVVTGSNYLVGEVARVPWVISRTRLQG